MLYQQANLVGHLSVADNVALAQHLNGRPRRRRLPRPQSSSAARSPHRAARPARPALRRRAGPRRPRRRAGQRPPSCWPTSPPASSTRRPPQRVLGAAARAAPTRRRPSWSSPTARDGRGAADREIQLRDGRVTHERRLTLVRCDGAARTYGRGAAATVALQADRLRGAPATGSPWSARRARASRRCCTCWPASTTPTLGTVSWPAIGARRLRPDRSPSSSRARACCRR